MEENIKLRIGTVLNDNGIDILSEDGDSLLHDLCRVIEQELDRAREEGMFTEDEIWTLSALVESKIDEIWDTMTLGTEKIVQEQSDDLHRLLSKLTTK